MLLKTTLIPSIFPIITFIVIPPKPKLPSGFSNTLFATGLSRKKINQAFIVTIKLMIDFKCFSSGCARESICFTYVNTYVNTTLDPIFLTIEHNLV